MTKQDIIADIRTRNCSASEEFLATFSEEDLLAYLSNLKEVVPTPAVSQPRSAQDRHAPERLFRPSRIPFFRSYKQYMVRSTRADTISCIKKSRNHAQLR